MFRVPTPQWYGSPGSTPFPSICKLLAAFPRSSLVFARSLQHVWLPASHLLGECYLLDDLRSTHTPSKYLRATYSHMYMCYVSNYFLFAKIIYIYIHTFMYLYIYICMYIHMYIFLHIHIFIYLHIYAYTYVNLFTYIHMYMYIYILYLHLYVNMCTYIDIYIYICIIYIVF